MLLALQVSQFLAGTKEAFSSPGSSGPEGQCAQAKRKLIGYTYLACLCLLDLSFFPLPPLRDEIFLSA